MKIYRLLPKSLFNWEGLGGYRAGLLSSKKNVDYYMPTTPTPPKTGGEYTS
jgi:hypothetical protein